MKTVLEIDRVNLPQDFILVTRVLEESRETAKQVHVYFYYSVFFWIGTKLLN